MGYKLVAHACLPLQDLHLSDRARLVLIQMARMAKDKAEQPIYYGGWEFLGEVLGFPEWNRSAKQAVARAVRELVDKKLIEGSQPGPGIPVEYRLRLDTWPRDTPKENCGEPTN